MKIEYAYQEQYPIGYATDGSAGIDLRFVDLQLEPENPFNGMFPDQEYYHFPSGLKNTFSQKTTTI